MGIVRTAIGVTPYAVTVTAGQHKFVADEPADHGGRDAGPAPYDLVLAGLGACSAITLRMYADRKQLPIRSLEINLSFKKEGERTSSGVSCTWTLISHPNNVRASPTSSSARR